MNFTTFSVANTNIFPHANSKYGGQLMSEFNVRSREMVAVNPSIKFECGPSFVHCEDDFKLSCSGSKIIIAPGRGVINGHYIETLTDMEVDLLEANIAAKSQQKEGLKGTLDIGFRIFYSTEPTMAGTMLVTKSVGTKTENSEDDILQEVYLGIQTVILPESKFKTPPEVANLEDVTAHIRLGRFSYYNGVVELSEEANQKIYTDKQRYISAQRITDIDSIVTDGFIRSDGLQPEQFYVFSGKTNNWCDATNSLMMWANSETPLRRNGVNIAPKVAERPDGKVALQIYRKPIDSQQVAESVQVVFPNADYSAGTAGMVSKEFTDHIKRIDYKFNELIQTVKGKQVAYFDVKDAETKLPEINQEHWSVGDYILVNQDFTVDESYSEGNKAPATMYMIIPGMVTALNTDGVIVKDRQWVTDSDGKLISGDDPTRVAPEALTGTELSVTIQHESNGAELPSGLTVPEIFAVGQNTALRGTPEEDYVVITYVFETVVTKDENEVVQEIKHHQKDYYYVVARSEDKQYSSAITLTGQVALAEESIVGGFYNVNPDEALDGGYIYRDENGHLRLLDYGLLRTGVLAYQLGEDYSTDNNVTAEELQSQLDDYVNQRVAFPNANATDENVITIDLNLTKEDEDAVINIYDIDSRFNTAVLININGDADEHTTVNIVNCEKVRVGNNISGTPIINIQKCNLYYDSVVVDTIRQSGGTFSDVKLWYERFEEEDPNLVVNDMTILELDAPISSSIIDYWSTDTPNDNHYAYALKSITFNDKLEIIRCELLVSNDSTNNTEERHSIVQHEFELPQGQGLTYPLSSITRPLKVTGTFVSAYLPKDGDGKWFVTDTNFSALSGVFDEFSGNIKLGSITFHASTHLILSNITAIDEWGPGKYHIFSGGVIS